MTQSETAKRLKFLKENNLPTLEIINFKNELKEIINKHNLHNSISGDCQIEIIKQFQDLIKEIESVEG